MAKTFFSENGFFSTSEPASVSLMTTNCVLTACDYSGFHDVEDLPVFFFRITQEFGSTNGQRDL